MREIVDLEERAQLLLPGAARGQHILHPWTTLGWCVAVGSRVEVDDFFHIAQLLENRCDREFDAGVGGLALKQRAQCEGENAVEGVHPKLLISPVERGREANPVGIFHLLERSFDVGLGSAAKDDLFCGPRMVVCAEDALAKASALELSKRLQIRPERELKTALRLRDLGLEDVADVLAGCDGVEPLLQGLGSVSLPSSARSLSDWMSSKRICTSQPGISTLPVARAQAMKASSGSALCPNISVVGFILVALD